MLEETGVHPGVTHDECVAVQQALRGHGRRDHFLCSIGDLEEIDAGFDTDFVEYRDQRLDRRIARTGTEAPDATVDLLGSSTHSLHRVGNPQAEILMAVEAHLRIVAKFGNQRRDPIGNISEHQGACRINDVDALTPGVSHDAGLLGEFLRGDRVAHHQEPDRLESEFAGQPEVLDRHISLGAVGGDPADRSAVVLSLSDVFLGAHTRQHQEGDLGFLGGLGGQFDQLLFRGFGEAVVEARPTEAVAVGHLDHRHACGVQRGNDRTDLIEGELMTFVMGAITQ